MDEGKLNVKTPFESSRTSIFNVRKTPRLPVDTLRGESTMDIGKPLQWFLVCPKNMLYTFRLN